MFGNLVCYKAQLPTTAGESWGVLQAGQFPSTREILIFPPAAFHGGKQSHKGLCSCSVFKPKKVKCLLCFCHLLAGETLIFTLLS